MTDETAVTLALRNRALGVSVATTGTTSLAATATGYTRSAGSFITDGFKVGMEFLASGFATSGNNGYKIVTAEPTAGTLTVSSLVTMAIEAEGGNELLIVRLPEGRAWENNAFNPTAFTGRPFVEEDFVPGGVPELMGQKNGGLVRETGLYVLKLYGLSDKGISAIRKTMDALRTLYAPGTTMTAGSHTVRSLGARAGQILPHGDGRSVCVLTVTWEVFSINQVAA